MKNKRYITPTKQATDSMTLTADGYIVSNYFCHPRQVALRLNK